MSQTLSTLFYNLQKKNIKYFLLTDYELDLQSNDVDLYVAPSCKTAFEESLLQLGWYKRKEKSYHLNHHFYFSTHADLYLDVKYELSFAQGTDNCFKYIHTESALRRCALNGQGVNRPTGIDAILLYAAHIGYKERGKLDFRHKHYLQQYIELYSSEITEEAYPFINELKTWLEESFPTGISRLQQILQPFFFHSRKTMVRRKEYIKFGYGLKVLFLGTDGAGKTTLLEAVEKKLNLKTNKLYLGMGEEGWTSAWVKRLYYQKLNLRIADLALSALKSYIVLPVELLLRQLPVKLKSKYSIVLIDRVPGANLIEKEPVKQLIYKSVIPKPDLVFFLYADPEVLQKRKPLENTVERSQAELAKFQKVAETISSGKYISLDTSHRTIEEARDLIIDEIFKSRKVYDNLLTTKLD